MSQIENASSPDEHPLVDRSALEPILRVTGPVVMRGIMDSFWKAADDMMAAIDSAIAADDKTALLRAAHTLKGAAANIGAGRAAAISAKLEKVEPASADPIVARLRETMKDTRPALYDMVQDAA